MFADLWNWIVSFWWTVVVTAGLSFFAISFLFNKSIEYNDAIISYKKDEYKEVIYLST